MSTQSIKNELQDFVQFASHRVERGEACESVEALVQQWRSDAEYSEAVADVRQGLADDAQGKAMPLSDAFADVRRQLGITD